MTDSTDTIVRIERERLWATSMEIIWPTAMVFVAGEHGGISHTPPEYSNPGTRGNGTDVLANAVLRLANPA